MLVEVRPLDVKKWHGKKGKDSFAQPKTIEVLYSSEVGGYDTGLTDDQAEKYSKLMGVDLSNRFDAENPHSYWSSKASWVNLPNQTLVLDTNKPNEAVKVLNLKASKYVANSMKEYEQGLFPDATHVIYSEEEEMEIKASKFQLQQQASVKLVDMSLDSKIALVLILSDKRVTSRSQNFVDGMISELVQEKPKELLDALALGKEQVTLRAFVKECIQKGILNKQSNGTIHFMGDQIAIDFEDAVKYFDDSNNAAMKVRLMDKLSLK